MKFVLIASVSFLTGMTAHAVIMFWDASIKAKKRLPRTKCEECGTSDFGVYSRLHKFDCPSIRRHLSRVTK